MKKTLSYFSTYIIAFIAVTVIIILLNNQFNNIFYLDFNPPVKVHQEKVLTSKDSTSYPGPYLKGQLTNSIDKKVTTLKQKSDSSGITKSAIIDSSLVDSLSELKHELKVNEKLYSKQVKLNETLQQQKDAEAKKDSAYMDWAKKTAKLYEKMDAVKAAKIIQNYSDNVARDIIYLMKQNKAAEILAQFSPEVANRITRAQ